MANEYSWVEPVLCDGVRDLCYAVERYAHAHVFMDRSLSHTFVSVLRCRTCSACLALAECLRSASTSAYIMLTEFSGRVVQVWSGVVPS